MVKKWPFISQFDASPSRLIWTEIEFKLLCPNNKPVVNYFSNVDNRPYCPNIYTVLSGQPNANVKSNSIGKQIRFSGQLHLLLQRITSQGP